MPMYEEKPVRVILTIEVDEHVLNFVDIGNAKGSRYHGDNPKSSVESLERSIRSVTDSSVRKVSDRAAVFLRSAYPIHTDRPGP